MNRIQEIIERLNQIAVELRADGITEERLAELTTESNNLMAERSQLETEHRRNEQLTRIANGGGTTLGGVIPPATPTPTPAHNVEPRGAVDRFDTPEYRNAFMEYVCRGRAIPAELRADALTTTGDTGAVIPTTTLQELIKKVESYGAIYARVRKLNVQGGVNIPILSLKPEATWIDETTTSDEQKLQANTSISFGYYGLECKLAQSLLVNIVTFDMFQREFINLATEAIVKRLEIDIFNGDGDGKLTGITVDSRVPAANKISISAADFASWEGWKKKIFAKMKKSYRNGIFIMSQATFDGYIDGMTDANGQPIGRVNYGIEGEEKYRFGGKVVETVEDDCIKSYDDAASGDVIAVFMRLEDYAINSNMQMRVVRWEDHDNNKIKNKCILICDGKLIDVNGVLIIKKA